MAKNLLTEAYENVRLKNLIENLRNEGKTSEEIEAYLVEAGLWDRLKASGASAVQSVKGAGQTVKGLAKQGVANVAQKGVDALSKYGGLAGQEAGKNMTTMVQGLKKSGEEQVKGVQDTAQAAKIDSIFQSHKKDINELMAAIVNDLKKLGIPTKGITENTANAFIGLIRKGLGLPKETTEEAPSKHAPVSAPKSTAGYMQTTSTPVLPTA